jgi:hypothetical protein
MHPTVDFTAHLTVLRCIASADTVETSASPRIRCEILSIRLGAREDGDAGKN